MEKVYLRPVGRLPAGCTRAKAPSAIFVGEDEHAGFAAAELIHRRDGTISRRMLAAEDLLVGPEPEVATVLQRIARPRRDLAGLTLDRPRIMGIVNVTPDSFSDGGLYFKPEAAIAHALQLEAEGADILDIGGESTRPGALPLDVEEECRRVIPVIAALAKSSKARLSVDTRNARVMQRAAEAGAHIVNDVSALQHDPNALAVAARTGMSVILMHMQGDPQTMQAKPSYADVLLDVSDMLAARVEACVAAGIAHDRIVVDPGIGFGKTLAHNLALLHGLSLLHGLGCPVLLGASRKSFIVRLMMREVGAEPTDRLPGSLAAALIGAQQGAQIIRVHDVAATRQALAMLAAA